MNGLRTKKTLTNDVQDKHVQEHTTIKELLLCNRKAQSRIWLLNRNARIGHFRVYIQFGKDYTVYAQRMRKVGKYYVEFIVGVAVSVVFTPLRFALVGKCYEDNLQCTGKLYESK